jgi:hypothetical protein
VLQDVRVVSRSEGKILQHSNTRQLSSRWQEQLQLTHTCFNPHTRKEHKPFSGAVKLHPSES